MPKNDIGGFFVSLGLNTDKNSFESANKLIDGIGNSFNKLIGSARNAAVVLAGTAVATGMVESQAYKLSEEIGISTESLNLWKATAKIAGVDANGLVSAMAKFSNVVQNMKIDGKGLQEFTTNLGKMGIVVDNVDIEKLLNLSPEEFMKEIFNFGQTALTKGADKSMVQQIIKDILGKEGMQLFIDLERRGKTITQALDEAQKTQFTTNQDTLDAANFLTEFNTLKETLKSLSKLLGDDIARELTPALSGLNQWFSENGDTIKSSLNTLAKWAGGIIEASAGSAERGAADAKDFIEGTDKIINGEVGEGTKQILLGSNFDEAVQEEVAAGGNETLAKMNIGTRSIPIIGSVSHITDYALLKAGKMSQEDYDALWGKHGAVNKARGIKDGIMRPDGTVTQVAPDDWVLATRNLGDLARAFIPQNHTALSAGEYTINQTFNISGNNDMPQVIRQQAYRGTQDGLLEIMSESSRRLQLMSGTR